MDWKSVFGHTWTDASYDETLHILKGESVPSTSNLKKRIKYYQAKQTNDNEWILVMPFRGVPPWSDTEVNVEFRVIKPSMIKPTLDEIMKDMANVKLSPHAMLDHLLRKGILGISRRAIERYLKDAPIAYRSIAPSKPVFKSFRPNAPFDHWQMDLIDFTNTTYKFKYILVIIDIFSKFVYLFPIKKKTTTSIKERLEDLFWAGDAPRILHTDNANEFKSLKSFCESFHVKLIHGPSYSPQTQGFVEKMNHYVKRLIHYAFRENHQTNLNELLPKIAYNINHTKQTVTGYTPIKLHRGRTPNETLCAINDDISIEDATDDSLNEHYNSFINRISKAKTIIHDNATRSEQSRMAKHSSFKVDDCVRVYTYVTTGCLHIQPIILKGIKNPLKVLKIQDVRKQYKHVDTILARPSSLFRKTDLKQKLLFEQEFKIVAYHEDGYKLAFEGDPVERQVSSDMWSLVFPGTLLVKIECPEENNEHSNITDIEAIQIMFKSPKIVQRSRIKVSVFIDNMVYQNVLIRKLAPEKGLYFVESSFPNFPKETRIRYHQLDPTKFEEHMDGGWAFVDPNVLNKFKS